MDKTLKTFQVIRRVERIVEIDEIYIVQAENEEEAIEKSKDELICYELEDENSIRYNDLRVDAGEPNYDSMEQVVNELVIDEQNDFQLFLCDFAGILGKKITQSAYGNKADWVKEYLAPYCKDTVFYFRGTGKQSNWFYFFKQFTNPGVFYCLKIIPRV